MAFNLSITAASILQEGKKLQIDDASVWADSDLAARNKYGVMLEGEYRMSDVPGEEEVVTFDSYDPITGIQWFADSPENGRYLFTAYAWIQKDEVVPSTDDVHIDPADGLLYQWSGSAWVLIAFNDTSKAKAAYTSTVLDVPLLSYAYAYKNILNLAYIEQVKWDVEHGAEQNKLYYKRTVLDYFSALILSAEYNWTIDLFYHYYQIVTTINKMINSGQLED
ncbi:hypothetical protein LCGC14_2185230 [marine sediment metagenome]|uniref:Uncharacterized protein n=1 Tax=marine sediment metagenome TaxID=412755 RepID=A0A0F9FYJ8_9ZZZZ|nr:hypothetical protein [Bacteroides sp.]